MNRSTSHGHASPSTINFDGVSLTGEGWSGGGVAAKVKHDMIKHVQTCDEGKICGPAQEEVLQDFAL